MSQPCTAHRLLPAAILLAFGSLAGSVQAADWGGYFRAGPATADKDAPRACYGLSGAGLKYRLGNECDIYGEFLMSQALKSEGVDYKASLMTNLWNPQTDTGTASMGIAQMFAEGKGYDIAPNTNFWIGKRYYGRADVHIVDTFFTKLDGVGGGAEIPLSVGKLNVAYFKQDVDAARSGNRLNVELSDIQVNKDGKLRVLLTATQGNFSASTAVGNTYAAGTSGTGLTIQHNQDKFLGLGGGNTLWLQTAQGSTGLDGNFGGLSNDNNIKSTRLVESMTWQVWVLSAAKPSPWCKTTMQRVSKRRLPPTAVGCLTPSRATSSCSVKWACRKRRSMAATPSNSPRSPWHRPWLSA